MQWQKVRIQFVLRIEEINAKGLDASNKEKNLLTVLELALEMCERGFHFKRLIYIVLVPMNLLLKGIH